MQKIQNIEDRLEEKVFWKNCIYILRRTRVAADDPLFSHVYNYVGDDGDDGEEFVSLLE